MDINSDIMDMTGWFEDLEVDCGRNDSYGSLYLKFICNQAYELQRFPGVSEFSYKSDAENDDLDDQGRGKLAEEDFGNPHAALDFVLGYLGVQDLLSVERVCKSLHSTIVSDSLLWRSVDIHQPLNREITDDVLLKLTSRAQGNLRCLSLTDCHKITDVGLRHVIESNPKLSKLCIPGCLGLSNDGIINSMKVLKHISGGPGIQHLRMGGSFCVSHQEFAEFESLLGINNETHKLCDDERAFDIGMCPKCNDLMLVYDWSQSESEIHGWCVDCKQRCVQCGRYMAGVEYDVTLFLDYICLDCLLEVQEGDYRWNV